MRRHVIPSGARKASAIEGGFTRRWTSHRTPGGVPLGVTAMALALALVYALGSGVRAQDDQAPSPSSSATESPLPIPKERAVSTHHAAVVGGKRVTYTATAGTILLRDAKERPTASVFYVAYVANGLGPTSRRPITFSYNGGPGVASDWVHMAAFGPRTIRTVNAGQTPQPPYDIIDNNDSLLDKTDHVFVDAVGTGFSKLAGKGTGKDYYGVDEDGKAFTQFIRRYITSNDRWNSPKYLAGESYGTMRSAVLANMLESSGIAVSGITLISTVLDFETIFGGQGADETYVSFLPTEAAVAAYHHKVAPPGSLDAWLREARAFAAGPYASALIEGDTLDDAGRRHIADELHRYTGLPVDYILRSNLRVPPFRFEKVLLGDREETIGRYDARFRGYDIDPIDADADSDPSDDAFSNAFNAAFNRYVREELHYKTDDEYVGVSDEVNEHWNWDRGGSSAPSSTEALDDLAQAMTTDRYLRVLSVNGIYDMATPFFGTETTLRHLGIAPQLQKNISFRYYPSGHAIYVNPEAHDALRADMDAFYAAGSRS